MSPTSYRTAPPRDMSCFTGLKEGCFYSICPLFVKGFFKVGGVEARFEKRFFAEKLP
jgi:hypothetical protein